MLRSGQESYVVLIPLLDDWEALRRLLPLLEAEFVAASLVGRVLLVDDGSHAPPPGDLIATPFVALRETMVLRLRRNMGHQRAIAIGFAHIAEHLTCSAVVVMDADGEDRPSDVPTLIAALYETPNEYAVFAKRARRSEGVVFRIAYALFRGFHSLLTGLRVEVGNFSAVPLGIVSQMCSVAEMWNHYAAAVVRARIRRKLVPTNRGTRLAGHSRMNFVALVTHGLGAISVFADRIGVRLLVGSVVLAALAVAGMLGVFYVRFFTTLAVPGWATSAMGLLAILLVQCVLLSLIFAVAVQVGRSAESFLPVRDYEYFVDSRSTISP